MWQRYYLTSYWSFRLLSCYYFRFFKHASFLSFVSDDNGGITSWHSKMYSMIRIGLQLNSAYRGEVWSKRKSMKALILLRLFYRYFNMTMREFTRRYYPERSASKSGVRITDVRFRSQITPILCQAIYSFTSWYNLFAYFNEINSIDILCFGRFIVYN